MSININTFYSLPVNQWPLCGSQDRLGVQDLDVSGDFLGAHPEGSAQRTPRDCTPPPTHHPTH